MGIIIKPIITKMGRGTRKINGMNLKMYRRTTAVTDAGTAKRVAKNIRETYVSG
jgi:hypothetical protein